MFAMIGRVRGDKQFRITREGKNVVDTTIDEITKSYKSTFRGY